MSLLETELPRSEGDRYGLQRTFMSSIRLNAQHHLWKEAVGYNIHPSIQVRNETEFKIADVGTGTAVWVTDVKREYPAVQVDGFDISLEQAPVQEWMPSGTSLAQLDITQPLPNSLKGKYDVVHVRLFVVVVRDNDPAPILTNLIQMLKPGGYLQWGEHIISAMTVESVSPLPDNSAMQALVRTVQGVGVGHWIPLLADHFHTHGLLDTQAKDYPISPHARLAWTQLQFHSAVDYTYVVMDNSTPDSAGPRSRELVSKAVEEARKGIGMGFVPFVVVGRFGNR